MNTEQIAIGTTISVLLGLVVYLIRPGRASARRAKTLARALLDDARKGNDSDQRTGRADDR